MLGFHPLAAAPFADVGLNAYKMDAAYGSFTLSGTELFQHLNSTAGSFTLTGQDVGVTKSLNIAADNGSFTLSGQTADPPQTPP